MIERKTNVLITGGDGQLGQCLKLLWNKHPELKLYFTSSKQLDITKKGLLGEFFKNNSFDYIINCAAYTNVEQAEKEPEKALLVNARGVKNLAEACKENCVTLIHISTDYVFDGTKTTPYTEEDIPNPINEYGKSKLIGERHIQKILEKHYIIRTSWLYSQFGKNFFKTILKKLETENQLTITALEIGTPTNTNDLAKFLLDLILNEKNKYGVYHYGNSGEVTWYDFAKEILKVSGKLGSIKLKKTDYYPTFAQRPKYSVLSKAKIQENLAASFVDWRKSLKKLMTN